MKTKTISTRLEEDELVQLDALASSCGLDRSGMTKSLLRRGLAELRFDAAVAAYREGRVTMSRAAEMASLSVWKGGRGQSNFPCFFSILHSLLSFCFR